MRIDGWTLVVEETGDEVNKGDALKTFRGEAAVLEGGRPPHHVGSSGKVYTDLGVHYPSVYGLEWVNASL